MEYPINDLRVELLRQQNNRSDITTDQWSAIALNKEIMIDLEENGTFALGEYAHNQLADICGIPKRYYDKLLDEDTTLLCDNINRVKKDILWRIVYGKIVAALSTQYLIINHMDVLDATINIINKIHRGTDTYQCYLTPRMMYVKITQSNIRLNVDGVSLTSGIIVANSETGHGPLSYDTLLQMDDITLIRNVPERKIHKGTANDLYERIDYMVNHAFDTAGINSWANSIRVCMNQVIEKPINTISEIEREYYITEQTSVNIFNKFTDNGARSRWGLAVAIATVARYDDTDIDDQIKLERIAGMVAVDTNRTSQTSLM